MQKSLQSPPKVPLFQLLKTPFENILAYYLRVAEFGDIVQMPVHRARYLINDPESIQRVLQTHVNNYTKQNTDYQRLQVALGPGLLTNFGDTWARRRAQLQPNFFIKNLAAWNGAIQEYIEDFLTNWETHAKQQEHFNMADELLALVAKISSMILFGIDIDQQTEKLIKLVHIGNDYVAKSFLTLPWLPTLKNIRFRISQKRLDDLLLTMLQTRRVTTPAAPLLANVIQEYENGVISREEFLGDIKNFFVAGHETTGNALNWTIYCLLQNPSTLEKLQEEFSNVLKGKIPAFEQLSALSYTDMIIAESIRLYPPIWALERRAIAEDQLNEFTIPANASLIICPYTIHRHPKYWQDPEIFNPERFTTEASKNRPKCAYIPFGTGPRVCIGRPVAMTIMKMVLPSILQRFVITLAQRQPVKTEALVTLKPKGGIWVRVKKLN